MAKTSYTAFRNANNSLFTVSGVKLGHAHVIGEKYMADGIINLVLSRFSVTLANAITLKNFPYKFKIIDATFNQHAGAGAPAADEIEIYNGTTSNASQYVCGISCQASRAFKRPTTINFNKSTVDTTDQLLILTTVADASAAAMQGTLTLYIRPI